MEKLNYWSSNGIYLRTIYLLKIPLFRGHPSKNRRRPEARFCADSRSSFQTIDEGPRNMTPSSTTIGG